MYPGVATTCSKQHVLCETSARQAEDALVLSAKKTKIANKHVVIDDFVRKAVWAGRIWSLAV
jgi:hypothetical protein